MDSSLQLLRTVRLFLLASIVLYAAIAERFGPAPKAHAPLVFYAITVVAISLIATTFAIRRGRLAKLEEVLSSHQEEMAALKPWRAIYLLIFMACEAVALYGLVLRFLGFTFTQVAPFYIAGFVLMLYFAPHRPSDAIG
ncbi:MAG TPA: hypothetical protein VEU11_07595 [Terriglobales bacterium]|nr:hypothetical protein [Terriglobales bacterium]